MSAAPAVPAATMSTALAYAGAPWLTPVEGNRALAAQHTARMPRLILVSSPPLAWAW